MNKGFTLIESIIYIALFSLLMRTAFVTAFQLIDGSGKLGVKNTVQEEGNFVMRKINWALTGVETITTPASGNSFTLVVEKYNGDDIEIKLDTKIEMKTNSGPFLPLTTDNVVVKASSLNFQHIPASGSGPVGIKADFVLTLNN